MRMKTIWRGLALLAMFIAPAQAQSVSPVGKWRTFDDNTGRERGLIGITEQNGVLFGRVLAILDPADAGHSCDACEDDRRGKPVIGLEIIRGMRAEGDSWGGGRILDPETGGIYRLSMKLEDGGAKLLLRGYLGISLFGRTQTWLRATP